MIDANHVAPFADVAMPPLGRTRFHGEPYADGWRKYRAAVFLRLGIEQFPTGHRYEARLNILLLKLLPRFDDQIHFRSRRDQDEFGPAVCRLGQDVGPAS